MLAFVALAIPMSLVVPSDPSGGGTSPYWQNALATAFMTWMVLVLLGLWDLIAMMIAASSRHRMRPKSFRLLVASLLCAPVVWIVPGLAGGGATLSHLVIDAVFVLNLLPVPEPAPPPGTWSG